jgi:virginiamycin B lyase
LTLGPDGTVWFAEYGQGVIGRVTSDGTLSAFTLTSASGDATSQATFGWLASGPNGHLWTLTAASILEIDTEGHIVHSLPYSTEVSAGLVAGPDGNLWVAAGLEIDRVTPTGVVTSFPCSDINHYVDVPAVGPDGNIWFVEQPNFVATSPNYVLGMVTTTGDAKLTEFTTDVQDLASVAAAIGMGVGPDGDLWFRANGAIARSTTAAAITVVPLPFGGEPEVFATSAEALWFADEQNRVGRIAASGNIQQFPMLITPAGIAIDADANVWVSGGGYLFRLHP